MDFLLNVLNKIEVSEESLQRLDGAYLLRGKKHVLSNTFEMVITSNDVLPFSVYKEISEKLENHLELKVILKVQPKKCTIDTSDYNLYFDYFLKQNNVKDSQAIIPLIENNSIHVSLYEGLEKKLKEFNDVIGVNYRLTTETIQPPKQEAPTKIISSKQPVQRDFYRPRTKEEAINKDEYNEVPMNMLRDGMNFVAVKGKIFKVDNQTLKRGSKLQKIYITDYQGAVVIKRFYRNGTSLEEFLDFKNDEIVVAYGKYTFDSFENSEVFEPKMIEKVKEDPWIREDNYQGDKYIELHAHTNRTEMDGISSVSELIRQAYAFGQPGIAVVDTNVVQAFPQAQNALLNMEKEHPESNFKVVYGVEMKVADEKFNIVFNPNEENVNDAEYVVLDLETTGLSTKYDYIIEFGGIYVSDGRVLERTRKQLFIKPPISLPEFIKHKTNITDEMLENALTIEEAIDEIVDYIGDRVIVAHNADFDFNFLNEKLVEMGREPLKNVCLDTLNLSKIVVTNRKYHRLGMIAKNYGVEYDDEAAHRGDYDAEVLANILVKMISDIPDYREITFNQLQNNQPSDVYKKTNTYSVTLLAKNKKGIKDIFELVSLAHTDYLTYFAKENAKKVDSDVTAEPRITKSEINKRRENLLIGSANLYSELFETALNRSDEQLSKCMEFYDYIEIQPLNNYSPLIEEGSSLNEERIKNVVNSIIKEADNQNKLVIANNDVYYTHPYQKVARDIYITAKRIGLGRHPLYIRNKEKRLKFVSPDQHLMTTQEMLDAFEFAGSRTKEFVIDNPRKIFDQIEKIYPIPMDLKTPHIEGCEDNLQKLVYDNAHRIYGNPLPKLVSERIEKELNSIITNGFSVQYYIAYLLVKASNEDGYIVGSRGSVGSSLIATMANITEVNPLVPHYVCPHCQHSEFFTKNEYANGFDLPDKNCPECGMPLEKNGMDIPFETFLGFHGDKVPDIDLNFAPDNQNKSQLLIRDIFGNDFTFRAGTIGTVAEKTAFGYVKNYCEEMGLVKSDGTTKFSNAYEEYLAHICTDVKRTTGQHPGGIVVVPKEYDILDFTPVQYPANNPFADWKTTHFAYLDMHDNLLKLDILGHVDPQAVRLLQIYTGIMPKDIPMDDKKTISLFNSKQALNINDPEGWYDDETGAMGLPEFGTHNIRGILTKTRPTSFAELVSLSGLTHGEDVWSNNAENLIDAGTHTLKDVIGCRDDIMTYLISKGLDNKEAFDIMEKVRKGKGLTKQWEQDMREHNVPEWYINSCNLIKYMFPKAHAVAYVMMAVRIAWWKVYHPAAYYAVYFSCRCDAYELETLLKGKEAIHERLVELREKMEKNSRSMSKKEKDLEATFEVALEMYLRGYKFSNISLSKSDATNFIVDPDDPTAIIPSFSSVDGLGENVARSIVAARKEYNFTSKEDLQKRTQVNNTQLNFLDRIGVLKGLTDEDQLSLF